MSTKRESPKPNKHPNNKENYHDGGQLHCQVSRAFYAYLGWLDRRLKETGLSKHLRPGMGPILFELFHEDNQIIKTLVESTGFVPSTLTRTLAKMNRAGLISQNPDKKDKRAVRIKLTKLGKSLEPACKKMAEEATTVMFQGVHIPEAQISSGVLSKIADNLRTAAIR